MNWRLLSYYAALLVRRLAVHRKLEGDTMRIVCPNWIRTYPIQCHAKQYNWRSWLKMLLLLWGQVDISQLVLTELCITFSCLLLLNCCQPNPQVLTLFPSSHWEWVSECLCGVELHSRLNCNVLRRHLRFSVLFLISDFYNFLCEVLIPL